MSHEPSALPSSTGPAALAAALVAAAAYFVGAVPLANIDDYNLLPFQRDFLGHWLGVAAGEAAGGRVRPLYWLLEGALGALTGSTGTVLHAGRLLFLAAGVVAFVVIAARLRAPLAVALALALAFAWSDPALDVWTRGGPAEAFAVPLALACVALTLRARALPGVAAAAAAGLLACLVKESFAPIVAAALLARGLWELLRGERAAAAVAGAGAAAAFLPAVVAAVAASRASGSYLQHVMVTLRMPPAELLSVAWDLNGFPAVAGAAGLLAIAVRAARLRPAAWALEDLVSVAVAVATLLATLAVGSGIARNHLPLSAALLLLAARGAAGLARAPRPRLVAAAVVVALAPIVAAGGVRAFTFARASAVEHRADERLRQLVATALRRHGAVRIDWVQWDVERAIGAITLVKAAGVPGEVELRPCDDVPPQMAEMFAELFKPWARPLGRWAPSVVSTDCPGIPRLATMRACKLLLPGAVEGPPGYRCFDFPERAISLGL